MIALGIVLVVLSGVFTLGVALSNTTQTHAAAFGVSLSNVTVGGLFMAGVATGAVLLLGLALLAGGAARKNRRRRAARAASREVASERSGLAEQNTRLQQELAARDAREQDAAYPAEPTGTGPARRPGLFRR